jgi:hypothetical protein
VGNLLRGCRSPDGLFFFFIARLCGGCAADDRRRHRGHGGGFQAVGYLGRKHRIALPYRLQRAPDNLPADLGARLADLDSRTGHNPYCRAVYMRKFLAKSFVR